MKLQARNTSLFPLLVAFYAFISIGMKAGLLNIGWTYMQDTFNVSLESLSIVLAALMLGTLLATFSSGRVIAQIGMGSSLIIGSLITIIGLVGYMLSPSFEILVLAVFVTATGSAMIDAGMNVFVSANYTSGPLNWLHAFFGVGLTMGPALMTIIVVNLDASWRWGYVVALVLQVILIGLFIFNRNYWKISYEDIETPGKSSSAGFWETLRLPAVIFGSLFFMLYGGVELGTGQLANSLFTEGRGIDQETAGFWVSVYWAAFTIGRMIAGTAGRRVSNYSWMRYGLIGAVIGSFLLWSNITDWLGFIGIAVLGFSLAPMFAVQTAETQKRLGKRYAANAIGFQIGFTVFGGAALPGLAVLLANRVGLEFIGTFIFINTILMVVAYVAMRRFDLRKSKQAVVQPVAG